MSGGDVVAEHDTSITVVVKSASLTYSDLTVICRPDWTVLQLKLHLQQQHPAKPSCACQRLIYYGHMLTDDAAQLCAVLRHSLTDSVPVSSHTIFLVCAAPPAAAAPAPASSSGGATGEAAAASDGSLRHRSCVTSSDEPDVSSVCQTGPVSAVSSPTLLSYHTNGDVPQQQQQEDQLAALHSVYSQYWNSYMLAVQSGTVWLPYNPSLAAGQSVPSSPPTVDSTPAAAATTESVAQQQQQQRGAEEGGEWLWEQQQWDWLEWLNAIIRLTLLVGTVLVHSSGVRLATLLACSLLFYLFENWYINGRRVARHARQQQQPPPAAAGPAEADAAAAAPAERAQTDPDAEAARDQLGAEDELNRALDEMGLPLQQPAPANATNLIWNIVASFFASLFPGLNAAQL